MKEFFNSLLENVQKYIQMMSLTDLLDILLVAFMIYQLIKLMRKTNAMRVIQGVALLLIIMLVAQVVGLHTISFVLTNTMQVGLLAIIIMFQPELRKMLESIGSSKLTNLIPRGEQARGVDAAIFQTIEACKALSWERTGALIVFERRVILTDVLKTGTTLSAEVSSELLKNIFFPKAPLHDGAVVIRDARVASAGCMLPLSNNTTISRDLGMRHRAALGMSENADAVCVVVSEETGSISVAQGGIIKRHLAPDMLEKILQNELMVDETGNNTKGIKRLTRRWRKSQ